MDPDRQLWNGRLLEPLSGSLALALNEVAAETRDAMTAALGSGELRSSRVEQCDCGRSQLSELSRYDRFGLPFGTVLCRSCGQVRLDPHLTEASLPRYYDRYYHPLHFGTRTHERRPALFMSGQGARLLRIARPYLPPRDRLRVLEIGAGTGSVLEEMRAEAAREGIGLEVSGTELSSDCVDVARQRGIELILGGLPEAVRLGDRFDVLVLSHVFEHFVDLDRSVRQISALLEDDGVVVVEVPGLMALHRRPAYAFDFVRYVTHAHIHHFNLASLVARFARGGFRPCYGDEEVTAVFGRGEIQLDVSDNGTKVVTYLALLERLGPELREARGERLSLEAGFRGLEARNRALEARLQSIEASRGWRYVAAPLKGIYRRFGRLRQRLRT